MLKFSVQEGRSGVIGFGFCFGEVLQSNRLGIGLLVDFVGHRSVLKQQVAVAAWILFVGKRRYHAECCDGVGAGRPVAG